MVRVRRYHLIDQIEHFQGIAKTVVGYVVVGADFDAQEVRTWRPDRPEGCPEIAFSEARDVDMTRCVCRKVGQDGQWMTVWQRI